MKKVLVFGFAFALLSASAGVPSDRLESAIARGRAYLLSVQAEDGHFSDPQMPALTALPLWALVAAGGERPAAVEKAARFVLAAQREDGGFYRPKPERGGGGLGNYNTAVCLSALHAAAAAPTAALLKARDYLASSQLEGDDTMAGGFGYDKVSRRRYADLSNTAYALDAMARTAALEELRPGGKRVDLNWEAALRFVERLQAQEGPDKGGAAYNDRTGQAGAATNRAGRVSLRAYGSMSYAAVLSMCAAKLDRGDPRVKNALAYCLEHWSVEENPGMGNQGLYYYYDILARSLAAAQVTVLEAKDGRQIDWKAELAEQLMKLQRPDGSWANDNNRFWETDPVLCTSFAMIALSLCR